MTDSTAASALRVVLVGAGAISGVWLDALAGNPEVRLVGVVDLDPRAAEAAAARSGPDVAVGADVVEVAARTGAEAVVDVTVPAAHHPVTTAALFAGLPVLGEKPAAETLARAVSLAAAAEVTGTLFMVSQARRYDPHLRAYRERVTAVGPVGILTTGFFREARFGGFREEMDHPLLLDMAIHPFDAARFLLDADPVAVYCEEFNPAWSWYRGAAAATATFEMSGGQRYVYTGSWCSPGHQTSWQGTWRASGARGTAGWDGYAPAGEPVSTPVGDEVAGALAEFVTALRTGATPMGEIHDNLLSLAMVEAAVESSATGGRVAVADVLDAAHERAIATESHPDVARHLRAARPTG
jgi:predicted dehydrogenase